MADSPNTTNPSETRAAPERRKHDLAELFPRAKGLVGLMIMASCDDCSMDETIRNSWFRSLSILDDLLDDIAVEVGQ